MISSAPRLFVAAAATLLYPVMAHAEPGAPEGRAEGSEELPRPLHEREDELGASRPAASDRAVQDQELDWPPITPSVAVSAHLNVSDQDIDQPGFGLWAGANYYPRPATYSSFWSLGLKIETNPNLYGDPVDVIPTLRGGFAWLHGDPTLFKRRLMPNLQVYALAGRRVRFDHLDPGEARWRAGMGVGSPRLSPATALMCFYGVPLPNALEVVVDTSADLSRRDLLVLISIGL